ncbi:hypothetical protein Poli38472_010442 [Pythium oligandrum]|uniref:glutathione gamma-glutamylcysteinyltransferase n=1 Tax=Pythium oligandrum TaxID=41045 RepID=A0A8K1F9T4_PYTOL|nr:hypothetical protein Poli38472_010442 [Pythium oligandrum]|eukprot:TMW55560.1 hypothetical protein Poli38472_010442 [Pythium oligandrum]
MLLSRRALCTRVLKRCRRDQQKTCVSSCSAACALRDAAPDLVCCQWPSVAATSASPASEEFNIPVVYHSQRSREQQHEMLSAWKDAMQRSDAIQRAQQQQKKECSLPMDMECGCKTKREEEEKEALALAEAQAKKQQQQQQLLEQERLRKEAEMMAATTPALQVEVINSAAQSKQLPQQMQMSFHRRHLPLDCIAFSSPEGRKLFVEALNSSQNHMQIYFPLAEQFITQAEPAYCGLSTLAMCLNALQIDPGRLWKGAWRWFSEELFDCCTSLSVAKEKGISLSEFICLARCNGVMTSDVRANEDFTLDQFREIVKKSCATNNQIVVLNYSRKVLGQTGDGHFSPIGGYHEERDMVLLLDVARFKYPPHWVKLSLVHAAMQRIDESSGKPRGLVVLKEGAHATGPTLVKNMVLSADPSMPVRPAPKVCCSTEKALESARHIVNNP